MIAPPGQETRPTADRVRQALFDMLMHADWGGRAALEGALVLDVFAGTGALGLEALSRGASHACFIETDRAALRALKANVAACKAESQTDILAVDACRISSMSHSAKVLSPAGSGADAPADGGHSAPGSLVFLDPPYGQALVPAAISRLREAGWISAGALIVAETGRDESWMPDQPVLTERLFGAARILVFRGP